MATIELPSNTVCNTVAHNTAYNANYDIVWSFDFSLSGSNAQGSFTTFLFDGTKELSGCGLGQGGAYYPAGTFTTNPVYTISLPEGESSPFFDGSRWNLPGPLVEGDFIGTLSFYTAASALTATIDLTQDITLAQVSAAILSSTVLSSYFVSLAQSSTSINAEWTFQGNVVGYIEENVSGAVYYNVINYPYLVTPIGIDGAVIGVNFDTTGYFALTADSIDGISSTSPDRLSIRYGSTDYSLLTSVSLSSLSNEFILLTSNQAFNRLRFRLTDVGQTLKVDYKPESSVYEEILSVPVNLTINDNTSYKIGIGYTAPVYGVDSIPAIFSIKNFHVEGQTSSPTYNEIATSNLSLSTLPICALPDTTAPDTPTTIRTLQRIPEIVCAPIDDSEDSRGICLAEFVELSGSDSFGVSGAQITGTFIYSVSAPDIPIDPPDPKPIIESCSLEYTDSIEFNGSTRNIVDFPVSHTVLIGDLTGRTGFDYKVYDQSVRFEVYYDNNRVIDTGYIYLNDEATYNLRSELALRNLTTGAVIAPSSNVVYFDRTTVSPNSAEIRVYGPVNGANYTIALLCPTLIPETYNCGTLITGVNYMSPLFAGYLFTPHIINLGSELGTVNVLYSAYGLPERFQVIYENEIIADTGWVGLSTNQNIRWLNSYLISTSQETISSIEAGSGTITFDKNTATETMEVRVFSPLYNSKWALSASCPFTPSPYSPAFIPASYIIDHIETFP